MPMAGLGKRFISQGIKPPKPLIKVLGTELIFWSLKSFEFQPSDNLFIVTQKKDRVKEKISKKLGRIKILDFTLSMFDNLNSQVASINYIWILPEKEV